jgi:hypothetical protein
MAATDGRRVLGRYCVGKNRPPDLAVARSAADVTRGGKKKMGWMMGLEPTTTWTTTRGSAN